MNDPSREFLRTDFGHEVYDEGYLGPGSYNFEAPEFVEKHFPFYEFEEKFSVIFFEGSFFLEVFRIDVIRFRGIRKLSPL